MTVQLRGLLVEDEPPSADLVMRSLNFEFRRINCAVKWEVCESALEALELDDDIDFDFAIVDYHLGDDQQSGYDVVKHLRSKSDETFILVISGRGSTHPDFITGSMEAGADHALIRGQLALKPSNPWSFHALAATIRRRSVAKNQAPDVEIRFVEDDLGMRSTLHNLGSPPTTDNDDVLEKGRQIVRKLIVSSLEPEYSGVETKLEVSHLAPGRSGAHVCRVDRSKLNQWTESYVLKIGLDAKALRHERVANQHAGEVLGQSTLMQMIGEVQVDSASGYAAATARLAAKAVTLATWFTSGTPEGARPTADRACEIADELFRDHLSQLFAKSRMKPVSAFDWLCVSPVLRSRTHQALAVYREVWSHGHGAGRHDAGDLAVMLSDFVDKTVLSSDIGAETLGDVTFVDGFGDLHSSNVLIQQGERLRPVLIDASMFGPSHWGVDAARLLVDTVLQVRRSGAQAMLWQDFHESCAYAARMCSFVEHKEVKDDAEPVEAFIAHVLGNLREYVHFHELGINESAWHWQWHVSVAKEFLRQGVRPGLVPPRAVLAMTSAAFHMTAAAQIIRGVSTAGSGSATSSVCSDPA